MICHARRCIFIHIPKTGGDSIEWAIWGPRRREAELFGGFVTALGNKYQTGGLQHLLARQVRQEVGAATFAACFRFTVVRNPWDRVVSQYAFMARRPDLRALIGMPEDACLAEYLDRTGQVEHVQWMPQRAFIEDADGQWLVDVVARFERLRQDMAEIFARIGMAGVELPHRNASRRARDYRGYYDAATRRIVALRYGGDIEAFGYRF